MAERESFVVGTRIGDERRYEIRERIGKGAMAEVYKAVDTRLNNRIVAVKTLSASIDAHAFKDRMRTLFVEEARALSRIKDDNVIAVLDSGVTPAGTPYMVMEFLRGQDLAQLLKQEKILSVERAVDVILGVCAGVHACHLAGIIHRDLKPANIFLDVTLKGEQTKVLDFSVAKIPIGRDHDEKENTRTDLIVGTPTYMSPEQALGKPANELSDQYSVGALLYRCLTGRPPQGVLPLPREDRPEIPEGLEQAVLRAMDARPEGRFPSVYDLGRALEPFASPIGRGRWKPYYTTPPVPVQVTSTRRALTDSSSTGLKPYDSGIHDRTTRVNRGNVREATTATVDPQGPSTVGAVSPTTVDNPARRSIAGAAVAASADQSHQPSISSPSDVLSLGTLSGASDPAVPPADVADVPDAIAASRSEPRRSFLRSIRALLGTVTAQRLIVASGMSLAVIIFGTLLAVRAWRAHPPVPQPSPPAWTRTVAPAPPIESPVARPVVPIEDARPVPLAVPLVPERTAPGAPANASAAMQSAEPASPTAEPERHKKRKKRGAGHAIEYTREGVPLLE